MEKSNETKKRNASEEGMMPVKEFALKCCANLFAVDDSVSVNDYLSIDNQLGIEKSINYS